MKKKKKKKKPIQGVGIEPTHTRNYRAPQAKVPSFLGGDHL